MFTIGSTFSGGGGWEEGAKQIGGEPLWGVELDPIRGEVWATNNPKAYLVAASVEAINPADLGTVDVYLTSPPCQPFNQARKKSLPASADLTIGLKTVDFAAAVKPQVIFLEEVLGYVWGPDGGINPIYEAIIHGLFALGYRFEHRILRAEEYGLPSRRERLYAAFLSKTVDFRWPEPTGITGNWYAAIEDLIDTLPAQTPPSPRQREGLEARPPRRWPVLLGNAWSVGSTGGVKIYHTEPGRPAQPMTASWEGMSGTRILFENGRCLRFTPRCAARLMGFSDAYWLPEGNEVAYNVIGNAVSPLMGRLILSGLDLDH